MSIPPVVYDHAPRHDRAVLRAAKSALDPSWVLNPGVLVDREKGDAIQ